MKNDFLSYYFSYHLYIKYFMTKTYFLKSMFSYEKVTMWYWRKLEVKSFMIWLMMLLMIFMSLWFMKLMQKVGLICRFSMLKSHIRLIINRNWVIVKVIVIDQRSWCIKLVSFVLLVKEIELLSKNNFYHVVHQQPQWLVPNHLSRPTFSWFVNQWKRIKEIWWYEVRY